MSYFEAKTITFEAAMRDLEHGSDRARAAAATALGGVTNPNQRREATRALIPLLSDLRPEIRAAASTSLGELGGSDAIKGLLSCLEDGVPHVRQTAAISLGRLGSDSAFPRLSQILTEGPADMRFQAATSLAEIDADQATAPLRAALRRETDDEVRAAIALALAATSDESSAPDIAKLLTSPRDRTRFDAAYALAQLGDSSGLGILRDSLEDSDLAWSAAEALEELGTRAAADALASAMRRRLASRELRVRAAAALIACADDHPDLTRAQDELTGALFSWWRGDLRTLALALLGEVGGEWAIDSLRQLRTRTRNCDAESDVDAAVERIERRLAEASSA